MRRAELGMTLMELMTVVVVAALIAVVGVPSYKAFVDRAKVAVAIGDIGSISLMLYRWQLATRNFPDSLAEAGLDGRIDPWGNPYYYLRIEGGANTGQVRRDRNLRPINTDFDLYSAGPDGVTQTQLQGNNARDDVVRANNGQFIGTASDY
jgi:general secretion pathway protein G